MIAPPFPVQASFWRGGTSRGLLFRASHLAPFQPAVRDRIILTALGSPDPDGRQIDGLGGGVSSLSKACIVSVPGEGASDQRLFGKLPGVEWADEGYRDSDRWDVVYRFAQVGVRKAELDWTATCGNMLAAVALRSVAEPILPYSTLFERARQLRPSHLGPDEERTPIMMPVNILSASNGVLMKARVPVDPETMQVWYPREGRGESIAGVPGRDIGIELESPFAKGSHPLPTGQPRDSLTVDGKEVPVSIVTAGLPNVYVQLSSLGFDDTLATTPSAQLQSNKALTTALEAVRRAASDKFGIPLSAASPKIVVVAKMPLDGYVTSSGEHVGRQDADLVVRAVSAGDFHATVPGTTLSAVNVGVAIRGTILYDLASSEDKTKDAEKVTVRVAHAAGVAESTVRFASGTQRRPESVLMMRTAREIFNGSIMIPSYVTDEMD